mgnify:CR=1 FL=1
MWDIFKDWIFDIIQFSYNFCHDWGLAIIIVTIIFRIIVAPLMHKQAKSNYAMQKVQPKIQALKDRFPDDPTRQSQEMQKIYAEMKFNPLAGCLPMLLQMPVLIAMFWFFPSAIELRGQHFLWATDLSAPDVIFTLPFTIPWYGNHVSLFCLLMTATNIIYTWICSSN